MTAGALSAVRDVAAICREIWEPVWPLWKLTGGHPEPLRDPPSHDCCVPTSFALEGVLAATAPQLRWRAVGGRPTRRTPAGGYTDGAGVAHPHLWVEGRARGILIGVDITGDQFGGPPVLAREGQSPLHVANSTADFLDRLRDNERRTFPDWMDLVARFG